MVRLIQDVHTEPGAPKCVPTLTTRRVLTFLSLPNVHVQKKAHARFQSVALFTAPSAPNAAPVSIPGLTDIFLKRLSTSILENMYAPLPIFHSNLIW